MKKIILLTVASICLLSFSKAKPIAPDSTIFKKVDEYFSLLTGQNRFCGSLLITRNGKTIISKGYGMANYEYNMPNAPETIFRIGSLSKQFTAMAIIQLEDKGLLSVNDFVSKYIPGYPNGNRITIHQLLCHRSGLPREKTGEESLKFPTTRKIAEYEQDLADSLLFEPGTDYFYSNVGYDLLAYIIEIVSGKTIENYTSENIFQPLGMKSSGFYDGKTVIKNRAYGYSHDSGNKIISSDNKELNSKGAGGIYSTVKDLAIWQDRLSEIVSEKGLKKIRTPYTEKGGYGYGIQVTKIDDQLSFLHTGGLDGYISFMMHLPNDKINVIFLSNFGDIQLVKIAKDIKSILFGKEYKLPKEVNRKAIKINTDLFTRLCGVYQLDLDKGQLFRIVAEKDKLFMIDNSDEKTELSPESEFVYFSNPESEDGVEFVKDKQGKVIYINLMTMGTKIKASKIK